MKLDHERLDVRHGSLDFTARMIGLRDQVPERGAVYEYVYEYGGEQ